MSAEALAQPIPVPAAITPTPASIAPTGAGFAEATAAQEMVAIRNPPTIRLSTPNTQVAQRCTATSTACPSPDTSTVHSSNTAMHTTVSTGCCLATGVVPNRMVARESSANAAVVVFTVSQPSREISDTAVGPMLPRAPNTARDRVSPGAPPRRPAMDTAPTMANEPTEPTAATSTACQTVSPCTATRVAPSGNPRMLMLAANQTQNSWLGRPVRSSRGTGSMPRVSSAPLDRPVTSESVLVAIVPSSGGAELEQPVDDWFQVQVVDPADGVQQVGRQRGHPVRGGQDRAAHRGHRVGVAAE